MIGMLTTMASVLLGAGKALFTNERALATVTAGFKHVATEIDESKLQPEEKLKYHARNVEQFVSWQRNEINESTSKARSRKRLALIITYGTLSLLGASAALYKVDNMYSTYLYLMAKDWMYYPFLAVIGYYFGIHLLDRRK